MGYEFQARVEIMRDIERKAQALADAVSKLPMTPEWIAAYGDNAYDCARDVRKALAESDGDDANDPCGPVWFGGDIRPDVYLGRV